MEQLKQFINSGKSIITDTKLAKSKAPKLAKLPEPEPTTSHEMFIRKMIDQKPGFSDVIDHIKTFIEKEEKKL